MKQLWIGLNNTKTNADLFLGIKDSFIKINMYNYYSYIQM